jgi:acetyltransferase-like isoleucine patch superfamily enzyme
LINGYLSYPAGEEGRLGLVRIGFHGGGDPAGVDGVEIELDSICELRVCISHANSKIKIGEEVWGKWVLRLFRDASVEIGNKVTCNKADVIIDNGELKVGDDCMFADIFIHAGDNHALFDVQSGEALNVRRAKVHIGPHVWIASRATILGDATIGAGSVVAANATVKGDVPSCALVAGIPARAIKVGVSWTRSANGDGWQDVVRQLSGLGDGQGG